MPSARSDRIWFYEEHRWASKWPLVASRFLLYHSWMALRMGVINKTVNCTNRPKGETALINQHGNPNIPYSAPNQDNSAIDTTIENTILYARPVCAMWERITASPTVITTLEMLWYLSQTANVPFPMMLWVAFISWNEMSVFSSCVHHESVLQLTIIDVKCCKRSILEQL